MNPIRNILVIVDPTAEGHPAINKAALLAQRFGARLELYVCDTKASREARLARQARQHPGQPPVASVKAMLEELAAPLRQRGLDVSTESEYADPLHQALIDRTRRTTADLVVKDTHHHSLAQRTFLTNTDWYLIRNCPVSLLLTKDTQWQARPRVFAAIDPGHTNDKPAALDHRILDHASGIARKLAGELHVVHAYLPVAIVAAAALGTPPMAMAVSAEEIMEEERCKRGEVQKLTANCGIDAAKIHLEVGGPADVLPRLAGSLHADIMIMGAISRGGLQRAFIGSTAEDVLERLPCDALVVKPPDFASMLPFSF